jgi:hypothetical protein
VGRNQSNYDPVYLECWSRRQCRPRWHDPPYRRVATSSHATLRRPHDELWPWLSPLQTRGQGEGRCVRSAARMRRNRPAINRKQFLNTRQTVAGLHTPQSDVELNLPKFYSARSYLFHHSLYYQFITPISLGTNNLTVWIKHKNKLTNYLLEKMIVA